MTPEQEGLSPVQRLDATHDVDSFACGKEPLDRLLKRFALANQKVDSVRTYVACRGLPVLAYYSLAPGAVEHADAPLRVGKGLPGTALVKDALLRTAAATDIAGIRALLVSIQGRRGAGLVRGLGVRAEPHGSLSPVLAHEGPAGDVEPLIKDPVMPSHATADVSTWLFSRLKVRSLRDGGPASV